MTENKIYCPILNHITNGCLKECCGWWNEERQMCAILALSMKEKAQEIQEARDETD